MQFDKSKLDFNWYVTESGCWHPMLRPQPDGRVYITRGKPPKVQRITRYVWRKLFDREPNGFLCHTCDNKRCCNPEHLYEGTHETNMHDMATRKRGTAKFTDLEVQEIRRAWAAREMTQVALAAKYGVTQACISLLILRKNYGWVP